MAEEVSGNTRGLSEERAEDSNERRIKLVMSNYSNDIQQLDDSDLVQIFNLGVAVKKLLPQTISEINDFKKGHMDDMKQIKTDNTQIQNELKTEDSTNVSSHKEEIAEMKTEIYSQGDGVSKIDDSTASPEDSRKEVNQDTPQMQEAATEGPSEEDKVLSTLKETFPAFKFTGVSKHQGKGDIKVQTPDNHQLFIKVKSCTSDIKKTDRDTFVKNVHNDVKVGLMFSLKSRIATKCKDRSFEIEPHNGKFLIYVPNASQQKDIMVWSVLLANELAGMNCNLKEGKPEQLQRLWENFKEQAKSAKKCRERMEIMKKAMEDLEAEIESVLDVFENAGKEINDIIKQ